MSEKWLQCGVSKGMFSDELAVTYSSPALRKTSVFVPIRFVEKVDGAIGRVKVRVFTRGLETWAILPSESQEQVLVRDRDIS